MAVYVVLVCLITILPWIRIGTFRFYRKTYCIIIGILMTAIMGFRSYSMGMYDVLDSYYPMFERIKTLSWGTTIAFYPNDVLFAIFTKACTYIIDDAHVWLFIISSFFISTVTVLIYRESKYPILSFILFLGFNYFGVAFTIIRQCVALSFVVISFLNYKNEKRIVGLAFAIVACGFHITAAAYFLFYFLAKFKIGWKQLLAVISMFLVASRFANTILANFFITFSADRFTRYVTTKTVTSFNYTMLLLALIPFLVAFFCIKRNRRIKSISEADKSLQFYFNFGMLNLIALCFINVWDLMFRVAMFYGIFTIILIPNAISVNPHKSERTIMACGLYVAFMAYFLAFALENAWIIPYVSFLAD